MQTTDCPTVNGFSIYAIIFILVTIPIYTQTCKRLIVNYLQSRLRLGFLFLGCLVVGVLNGRFDYVKERAFDNKFFFVLATSLFCMWVICCFVFHCLSCSLFNHLLPVVKNLFKNILINKWRRASGYHYLFQPISFGLSPVRKFKPI